MQQSLCLLWGEWAFFALLYQPRLIIVEITSLINLPLRRAFNFCQMSSHHRDLEDYSFEQFVYSGPFLGLIALLLQDQPRRKF